MVLQIRYIQMKEVVLRRSFCVKMKNTLLSAGQSTTPVTETPRGRQSYGATDSIHSDEGGSNA